MRGFPVPPSLHVNVPVTPDAVMVALPQLLIIFNIGALGITLGFAVTELLFALVHPFVVCVTVYVPALTVRGFPVPPSLQVNVPVTPVAVIVDVPQLLMTLNTGALGKALGLAVTALLVALVHPLDVCVTVYVPELTVRGFPVPPSLQVNVPVTPVAVIVDVPQLLMTLNTGALGTALGLAVTALLDALVHPLDVCVTVYVPALTVRGFPVPPSLHVNVPVTPDAVIVDVPQLLMTLNTGVLGKALGLAVTALLDALVHPLDVCVTVYVPALTVRGFPVPPSLQVNVPVTPVAVIVDVPQLLMTLNTGALGTALGLAVTALLDALVHPLDVCVTV